MNKELFKNAIFGDKYIMRNGKIAIFQRKDSTLAYLFTEDTEIHPYLIDGCVDSRFYSNDYDIIARDW